MASKRTRKHPQSGLERALRDFDPSMLESHRAEAQLNLRVSKQEREQIQAVADHFGMKITDYILSLHRIVAEKLRGKD